MRQLQFDAILSPESTTEHWPNNGSANDVVNVASVPQLSPFRYPGGKTWLVPVIRKWLSLLATDCDVLVEPFAGGGIVSLTALNENYIDRALLCEIDPEVASVWLTIVSEDVEWLTEQIMDFDITLDNVRRIIDSKPTSVRETAFRTIVKNRTQRGGILAKGASLMKSGENGKGVASRWYPQTLVKRINRIHMLRERLDVIHGDGMDLINRYSDNSNVCFFIDPPYTASGRSAGRRLYEFHELDHDRLFQMVHSTNGEVLMTYDETSEVLRLASNWELKVDRVQ